MTNLVPGQTFKATIEDLGLEGQGFFRHGSGMAVFVPGAWPGELCEVEILKVKKRLAEARLIEVIKPSSHRRQSPCENSGLGHRQCNNCLWIDFNEGAQLKAKEGLFRQSLERAGWALSGIKVHASPESFHYRNRAQLKTDGEEIGYINRHDKKLVPIQKCLLLSSELQAQLDELRSQLPQKCWRPQDGREFSFFDLKEGHAPQVNQARKFAQGNSAINRVMQSWLGEKAKVWPEEVQVLELFSGSGNFTQILYQAGLKNITAVEAVTSATNKLEEKLPEVRALALDLYEKKNLAKVNWSGVEYLVLDPPRSGFPALGECVKQASKLKEILYVSCDLHSLARDLRPLKELGFSIKDAQLVDQFPQTPHIESLLHMVRA